VSTYGTRRATSGSAARSDMWLLGVTVAGGVTLGLRRRSTSAPDKRGGREALAWTVRRGLRALVHAGERPSARIHVVEAPALDKNLLAGLQGRAVNECLPRRQGCQRERGSLLMGDRTWPGGWVGGRQCHELGRRPIAVEVDQPVDLVADGQAVGFRAEARHRS